MAEKWTAVRVRMAGSEDAVAEAIMAMATMSASCGTAEEPSGDSSLRQWVIYFEEKPDLSALEQQLEQLAGSLSLKVAGPVEWFEVEKENWNENWRQYFHPVQVTDRIVVCPPWEADAIPADKVKLVINPGMAFGTGTHATTQLCMELGEKTIAVGDRVLDVGTGTGILCIMAVRLGAAFAAGFDNDPDISENAHENMQLNSVDGGQVGIFVGSIDAVASKSFDVILCNMLSTQFLPVLDAIVARCRPGGKVVLSGFLLTEREEVEAAVQRAGGEVILSSAREEWGGLVFATGRV